MQKIQGIPRDRIAEQLRSSGGAEDPEHPDFQLGEGCLADQLIGQYLADIAGLGPLLAPDSIRTTLASILRYNYRSSLARHDSVQRVYALNDEAAVLVCDYGAAKRPSIPFPYYAESWTGIEYLFATQLFFSGKIDEGVRCYENVRRRYDGERRNPWDEFECGHHYARAMSAWSGVLALSGFRYRGDDTKIVVAPLLAAADFRSFWSTATGWGVFWQAVRNGRTRFGLSVIEGKLPCHAVELAVETPLGTKSVARAGDNVLAHELRRQDKRTVFSFAETVALAPGADLNLEL